MKDNKQSEEKYDFRVCDLCWERVFLNFVIEGTDNSEAYFALKNLSNSKIIPLRVEEQEGNRYFLCLNMTAADVRSFLDNGRWLVVYGDGGKDWYPCLLDVELGYRLETMMRIFRYGDDAYAYTVDFVLDTYDQIHMVLILRSFFMKKNNKWRKRADFSGSDSHNAVRTIIRKAGILGVNILYDCFGLFRSKSRTRLMLMNESNSMNAGNLEALARRLEERGIDKIIDISYSYRCAVGKRSSIFSWIKLLYKTARQDIIVVDNYVPLFSFLRLRRDVELIQLWHAGGGFKAVGYCRFGKEGSPHPAGSCHKAYTTAVTGSEQLIKIFSEVFGIEREAFYPAGMPRLDGFLDKKKIEDFRKDFYGTYHQFIDKKIILFAPTYRGAGQKTAYYDYNRLDFGRIYDVCGEEYIFLIKMHPFIKEPPEISDEYKDRIYDFSAYPSINDLYYVTDLLITDYSSNFYEYSLMKKPILFYTYDRHIYELIRGVYRGVKESAPGKVCDTFDELIDAIRNKDFEYEKVLKFVEENFGDTNGYATDKVIDNIILKKSGITENDNCSD